MSTVEPYTGATLPDAADADDVPADLASIFDVIKSQFVLRATDAAQRNTKYGAAPVGTMVVTTNDYNLWIKNGTASTAWVSRYSDTGWVTTGGTAGSGFTLTYMKMRNLNGLIEVRTLVNRSGADITTTASGNVHAGNVAGDPTVATVPSAYCPADTLPGVGSGNFGSWGVRLNSDGTIRLLDGPPDAALESGQDLYTQFIFVKG